MVRKNLRVISDGETAPEPAKPVKLTVAAAEGDGWGMLLAMRTRLAKAVESPETPPRDLASLTKRLMEVQREIELIEAREGQEVESVARRVQDDSFDASAI